MRPWLAIFACLTLPVGAANWYVDNAATGANNGTSWANAWSNPTNVVWASVSPGDVVYVSGGTTSKVYTNNLVIGKDGTNNAYITVRIGQDAGHNGVAIFTNAAIRPNGSYPKWNWIDGSRNPNFVAPTNHRQVVNGPTAITNNIGFRIQNVVGTNNSDTSPVVWFMRHPDSCKFSWIEISGLTNTGNFEFNSTRGTVCYIDMSSEGSVPATNNVFEYLYLHQNMGQQFAKVGGTPSGFDDFVFRFGYIYQGGEDHFETGGGFTVRDSVIGPCYPNGVHNDFFQFTGDYIKVYNNDIRESQNSIMRIQTSPGGGGTNISLRHDVWFFNNLVTEKEGRALGGGTLTEPICMVHFDSQSPTYMTVLSNLVFANNLFYNSVSNSGQGYGTDSRLLEMCRNPVLTWSRGAQVTNAMVVSNKFVNNLVVMKHKGIAFPSSTNVSASGTYLPFSTNDMWVDYNIFAGTNTAAIIGPRMLTYMDVTTNAEIHPFRFANTTNFPAWENVPTDNFELNRSDTAALNDGYDMSSYFNFDALNRPRNVSGAWDRGPLELQTVDTNLLVSLTFEDDFSDGKLDDHSGHGNNAYRFGRPGSTYPTNFPTQVVSSTVTGTNGSGYAGNFVWWTNADYGLYNRDGQYGAITNVSAFTNLSQMTIMVRARYNSTKRIDASYDYSQDGNACLISGGTSSGVVGAWDLGRFNQAVWLNNTRFYLVTNSNFGVSQVGSGSDLVFGKAGKIVFNFPDSGFSNNGDTTNWHHYAVTFNSGVIKTYFDGAPLATNDVSAVLTRATIGWNNNVAVTTAFIGIGCDTHGGTPALEDESGVDYPNNGFFNGAMDDVAIYDKALSAAQVASISGYSVEAAIEPPVVMIPTHLRMRVR